MTRFRLLKAITATAAVTGSFFSMIPAGFAQADSGKDEAAAASVLKNSMMVTPLRVDVTGAENAEMVMVRNSSARPLAMQARLFAWNQNGGEESFAPSGDFLLTPSIVSIAAGQTQIVRLVRKVPASPGEKRYRLIVDQLPDPSQAKAGETMTRVRFSVPVFVDSDKAAPAQLAWRLTNGELQLTNTGGAAARIVRLDLKAADGREVPVENNALRYVFGANSIRWPVGKGCSYGKVRVTAEIDGQTVDAEPAATCG